MIAFDQWKLPDGETHLQEWMSRIHNRQEGRLTYQFHKYAEALKRCRPARRVAIDIGAHVGLWSYWMARDFQVLHAFEPKAEHRACWLENMKSRTGEAHLYDQALGHQAGECGLHTGPSSSGDTQVRLDAAGIPMRTLDSYHFSNVDFIKIDCEGFEAFIVEGALETITRWLPVVIVEQKPGHGQRFGRGELDAVRILEKQGFYCEHMRDGDFVMRHPKS